MEEVEVFLLSLMIGWGAAALVVMTVGRLLKMRIKLNLLCIAGVALGFVAFRFGEWDVVHRDMAVNLGQFWFAAATIAALVTPAAALLQYFSFLVDFEAAFSVHGRIDGGIWWWIALASYAIVMLSLVIPLGVGHKGKPRIVDRALTITLRRGANGREPSPPADQSA